MFFSAIKNFLEKAGYYCLLLPVFFILFNYNLYAGLVSGFTAVKLLLKIIFIVAVVFFVLNFFLRNYNRSFLITFMLSAVILFFGNFQQLLHQISRSGFPARYAVYLPVLFITCLVFTWYVLKKKQFKTLHFYLNLLLLLFIFIETGKLVYNTATGSSNKNLLSKNASGNTEIHSTPTIQPDLYYLVFDSYPGSSFLRNVMNFDNSPFNDSLKKSGFYVIPDPKSNYNRTAFSMAATLNYELPGKITAGYPVEARDYYHAQQTIKKAAVPRFLMSNGYAFYNLSMFEFDSAASPRKETFLTLTDEKILIYNTMFEKLRREVFWHLLTGKTAIPILQKLVKRDEADNLKEASERRKYNNEMLDSTRKIASSPTGKPKFVYVHVYLPHPPFFYDENGNSTDLRKMMTNEAMEDSSLFISYLQYTNKKILQVTNHIMKASSGKAVIIIQSDHGYRDFKNYRARPELFHQNYSAFYFPDKDYSKLYDTISTVNTFPVVFNKYFSTSISLQPDTTIYLAY